MDWLGVVVEPFVADVGIDTNEEEEEVELALVVLDDDTSDITEVVLSTESAANISPFAES